VTRPVELSAVEASMVLSNWWRAEVRNEYRHPPISAEELVGNDWQYATLIGRLGATRLGLERVAACIVVRKPRRRARR
jgi:hypothetical protein